MDAETLEKVSVLQKQKSYLLAIEHIKSQLSKYQKDEKWLEAALAQMTDLLVLARFEPFC